MTVAIFGILALLLVLNAPIFVALSGTVLIIFATMTDFPLTTVILRQFAGLNKFALMSIPFFILAANIMGKGGISRRLVDLARGLVGFLPGGLGMTAILASLFFGAISGSAPATVIAIGAILYHPLLENKYGENFSAGLITSAGALGIIIPPSVTMIVFGAVTGTSVGTLFMAGFGAGALFGLLFMIYSYIYAIRHKEIVVTKRPSAKEVIDAFKGSTLGVGVPVIIIGGIYGGIFTPTEAAGVAVIYALIVAMFVYREMSWKDLYGVLVNSAVTTAGVMIILSSAAVFSWILTSQGITVGITQGIVSISNSKIAVLVMINIAVLVAGMFIDGASIITILGPLLMPIALQYGIDPIHLGVIVTVNCAIGMFTPPFGLNLFVASGVTDLSIMRVTKGALPFIAISIVTLILVTYVPDISLWLPRVVYGTW